MALPRNYFFIETFVYVRLNACVPETTPTEPNSPDAVQNLIITEELVAAAKVVTCEFNYLFAFDDEDRRSTSDIVIDFNFQTEDQAKRAELLLCEILARSCPVVVDTVIADFQHQVALILKPIPEALKNVKIDQVLEKLQAIQISVGKIENEAAKLASDLKHQIKSQSWEQVAFVWVKMNQFLEDLKGLRTETLGLQNELWRTHGLKPADGRYTFPFTNAQIDPVVRNTRVVRVTFDLFIGSWPAKFCRDIAGIVNPGCKFMGEVKDLELVFGFGQFYSEFGSLIPFLYDEEKHHPKTLLDIKGRFDEFFKAQGAFCKQMQLVSNENLISGTAPGNKTGTILSSNSELNLLVVKEFGSQLKILDSQLNKFEAENTRLDRSTATLAKDIEPLKKIYPQDPELGEIRKRAMGKNVPAHFYDWVINIFLASNPNKLPSKTEAFQNCGPGTLIGKRISAEGRGLSVPTFARHLGVIRTLLVEKGHLAAQPKGEKRRQARNYDPGNERQEDINQSDPSEQAADREVAAAREESALIRQQPQRPSSRDELSEQDGIHPDAQNYSVPDTRAQELGEGGEESSE